MLCEFVWRDRREGADEHGLDKKDKEAVATYDEYRREYCLSYVRKFFNEHMDDSWFRKAYSPLGQKRAVLEELERALQEAAAFRQQIGASPVTFMEQAQLGGGIKEAAPPSTFRKRKYSEEDAPPPANTIPQSHVLSTDDRTLALFHIPPHVTDDQLSQALSEHLSTPSAIKIYSSSVSVSTELPLVRSAYAVVESQNVRKAILTNLAKAYNRPHDQPTGSGTHVPRKEDSLPRELDLDVECSDPYGRVDVDEDGKGAGGGSRTVPLRNCVVVVSTAPHHQPITVLSAAVSSVERMPRDKGAAAVLARALDVSRSIPTDCRLDACLELLPPDKSDEDALDVSIAYLRRVHLFSFYNGCNSTRHLGDVLAEKHAAGTIHLRLKGANDFLEIVDEKEKANDLLVMRLDESISRALEKSSQWISHGHVLSEELDAKAAELEEMEEQARYDFVESHAIVDEAGRGRCAFHFCRKLFKDDNFLKKHLLKKHGEFLRAAMAACHDSFMMKAWDQESNRPVPPILVDCGATFGLVPSPVVGVEPMAEDPEPALWRREEEQRKEKEQDRHAELERAKHSRAPHDFVDEAPRSRASNFVDVDDMKEEKVELSFENAQVVAPPLKKKKKKMRLL
jgi:hypothetical protein